VLLGIWLVVIILGGQEYFSNNLLYGINGSAITRFGGTVNNDYNCLYNNTNDYGGGITAGSNSICSENSNAIDPADGTPGNGTAALKYLTRIEDGSDLDGAASDGGDIGPTILKKIGVDGTFYGETGYDTETTENLWPWPNEDIIREHMRAYSYDNGNLTGARGFCADGQTLSKYIWGYLGNDVPLVVPPDNLAAAVVSLSAIDLSWEDVSLYEDGYKIERKQGSSGSYAQIATTSADVTSYSDTGLSSGTTYYYRVRAYDSSTDSAYSNEASATTTAVVASAGGGGGGGVCFIATAAFGTTMAKEVRVLCELRDKYLLTNPWGTEFVKFYYRYSPPIADRIRNNEGLKKVIRICLKPLISLSREICK